MDYQLQIISPPMFSDKQASPFLFASPDRRAPSSSARRVHLRRLSDILHLSIQRGDLHLARSAFGLLARCEDVEWAAIWKFGLGILAAAAAADDPPPPPPGDVLLQTPKHIEFLQVMMLRHPEQVRAASLFFLSFFHAKFTTHQNSPFRLHSANRSCGNWCYRWRWLDGSATRSMN